MKEENHEKGSNGKSPKEGSVNNSIPARLRSQSCMPYEEALKLGLLKSPVLKYSFISKLFLSRPIKNNCPDPTPLELPPIDESAVSLMDSLEYVGGSSFNGKYKIT